MEFKEAVDILNKLLSEKEPSKFNSSWILNNAPRVYQYINKNVRTQNNKIDWDKITRYLDKDSGNIGNIQGLHQSLIGIKKKFIGS